MTGTQISDMVLSPTIPDGAVVPFVVPPATPGFNPALNYIYDLGADLLTRVSYAALISTLPGKGASLVSFESGYTVQDLASSDADKGAALVSLALGGTAQDAVKFITAAMAGIPDNGNPALDVTAELLALAAKATALRLPVVLGNRTYLTNGTTIEFSTSVSGTGIGPTDTLIKSTSTGTSGAVVKLVGPATLSSLRIDGNVSADPVSWNAGNYDSFTGSEGLIVDSDDCVVQNVIVTNVRRAAFKVEIPRKRVRFENCQSSRSRGNFGDGFIAMGAEQIKYLDCRAYDFTRIGFVSDSYGDQPGTYSKNVSYENCEAEFGHDASINYGGLEYNAGFWSEKSGNVARKNCVATDCGNRGYTDATGEDVDGSGIAQFVSENCVTLSTEFGHIAQGLDGIPLNSVLINCRAKVTGQTAYSYTGGLTKDVITMVACSSSLSADTLNRSSVKASPGTLVIDGFTETWATVNTTYRDATDNYYGSLSHFADAPGKVVVSDWTTYNNSGTQIYSVFKFLPSAAASLDIHVDRCRLRGVYLNAVSVATQDVTWERFGSIETKTLLVQGGVNYETDAPFFSCPIFDTTKSLTFVDVRFDFDASGNYLWFRNINSINPYAKLIFHDCTFIKDYAVKSRAVLLDMAGGPSGTIASTTDASHIYATGVIATNTGSSTTNPVFLIDSNTDAAGKLNGDGKKSSTITNMVQSGKLATSASFTAWGS